MHRKLLIDGDIVAYRFSAQTETRFDFGDEPTYHGDTDAAMRSARSWLNFMMDRLKADSYLMCFSSEDHRYFRHDLWPEYKQHRTQGRPPVHRHEVEARLKAEFDAKVKPGLEADDVMGILATWEHFCPDCDKIIVSLDKDMKCVPGSHFNYEKDTDVRLLSETEADIFHMTQTLTGDTCDGFKGCPGIGPKRAEKILSPTDGDPVLMWQAVLNAFKLRGLTEADAIREARMARILRASDFDFTRQQPIPWVPPQLPEN